MKFQEIEIEAIKDTISHWEKDIMEYLCHTAEIFVGRQGELRWAEGEMVKCYADDSALCRLASDRSGKVDCFKCPYHRYYGISCNTIGSKWRTFINSPDLKTCEEMIASLRNLLDYASNRTVASGVRSRELTVRPGPRSQCQKTILFVYRPGPWHNLFEEEVKERLGTDVRIIHAFSPPEAIAYLLTERIDLVISEILLKDRKRHGIELLNAAKMLFPSLPFLIFCAWEYQDEMFGEGRRPDAYVEMTADLNSLTSKIEELLQIREERDNRHIFVQLNPALGALGLNFPKLLRIIKWINPSLGRKLSGLVSFNLN